MLDRKHLAILPLFLICLVATAKDKKKNLLPADVLQARTVLVLIDPRAGMDVQDPNANRIAREDVEKALTNWGRYSLVMEARTADLIITVRKGSGRLAHPTIGGMPNNDRPVVMQPTDSGTRIGGRQGNPGIGGGAQDAQYPSGPQPQVEMGQSEDMFVVYRGNAKNDSSVHWSDAPPVWRYSAETALESPSVPAVEFFRKLVADSEKQLAKTP